MTSRRAADVFVECLRAGFDEVLALGGAYETARLPLRTPEPGRKPPVAYGRRASTRARRNKRPPSVER